MARRHALKEELTRLLEGSFPKSPHLSDICPVMEAPQAHACPCVDKRTKCDWGWQGGDSLLRIFNVKVPCKSKFDQDEECR